MMVINPRQIIGLRQRGWMIPQQSYQWFSTKRRVFIPDYIRAKDLGKLLRGQNALSVAKALCVRKHRHFYLTYQNDVYDFPKLNEIILPFEVVAPFVDRIGMVAQHVRLDPMPLDEIPERGNWKIGQRPPVIAVMGHVNHGKTSLLDTLRGSRIVDTEVEGITQTINVSEAIIDDEAKTVATFLDTPGHYHFFRMRSNAAHLADLALLVVSLDEGPLLQTEEAIGCIEELNLPVVVCLNKLDLVSVDQVKKVEDDLRQYVALEDAQMIPISALDKSTLHPMLRAVRDIVKDSESVCLDAIHDPKVHNADGVALEFITSRRTGSVIRVLIKNGIVRSKTDFVCGFVHGRIRSLTNVSSGEEVEEALPGHVVDVSYSKQSKDKKKDAPLEMNFHIVSKVDAKNIIDNRKMAIDFETYKQEPMLNDEDYDELEVDNEVKNDGEETISLINKPIIIKADSAGTLASVVDTLQMDIPNLQLVHVGIGEVCEQDIKHAHGDDDTCPIFCFKVGMPKRMEKVAAKVNVPVKSYNTVHQLIADAEKYALT